MIEELETAQRIMKVTRLMAHPNIVAVLKVPRNAMIAVKSTGKQGVGMVGACVGAPTSDACAADRSLGPDWGRRWDWGMGRGTKAASRHSQDVTQTGGDLCSVMATAVPRAGDYLRSHRAQVGMPQGVLYPLVFGQSMKVLSHTQQLCFTAFEVLGSQAYKSPIDRVCSIPRPFEAHSDPI